MREEYAVEELVKRLKKLRKRLANYKYNTDMRENLAFAEAKIVEMLIEQGMYLDHDGNLFKFETLHGTHRLNILKKYHVHYITLRNP